MPSPGGQVSEMVGHADRCPQSGGVLAGARHLVDLPEGYHAPAGGQAWHDQVRIGDRLPSGRRVIGLRQVDEMVLRLGRLVGARPRFGVERWLRSLPRPARW